MVHCEVPWHPAQLLASNRVLPAATSAAVRLVGARGARMAFTYSSISFQSGRTVLGVVGPPAIIEIIEPVRPVCGVAVACCSAAGAAPSKMIRSLAAAGGPGRCTKAPTPPEFPRVL